MNLKEIPMANPDLGVLEEKAILDVFRSGWLGQGKKTREFEKLLSKFFSSNAIAVNSGSSAIMCALLAHGIKPGDSVVVPNFTFMSTASVPKILGAEIIPVDIDPATLNLDVQALEEVLKKKEIKFVIFVDVAGLANDIDSLVDLSKRYNFTLLEDAAEALGSEYKKKRLGSFDHTTIFSFHVAKQITTIEGGCITTKDEKLAKKISAIKDIGRTGSGIAGKGYKHDFLGSNFRITDILSTIGIQQLKKIDKILEKKQRISSLYTEKIKGLTFQEIPSYSTLHSHMLFFAIAKDENARNRYVEELRKNKIDSRIAWTPIHQQPCFPELNHLSYKNSEDISNRSFIVPIFNTITDEQVSTIISKINEIEI